MYLLERQRKILGLLLANEQRMTGSQIAQMIGITDRTVRNDIKDLNEGLKEYPDSYVESIRGKGYLLVSKHKEELLKQVEQSNSNETTKGRLCNLALEILTVDEPILLDDLETDFFISRTPLETSIKCINEQCSQESKNNVIRRKNNAVYAECSEEERRSLIRKYIVLSSEYSGDFFRDEYGVLDKDYVKALINHICRVLAKQGMQLTDKDMMEVVLFLYIQNMRILKEAYVTIEACIRAGKPCSLCGEMAADIQAVPILLGLGLRKFSVNPSLVLAVKQVLANSSVDEVKQLAIKACETNSAEDVRKLIKTKSGDRCYGDN